MVKHIVMFKLTGDAATRRAVAEKFAQALRNLPAQIEVLQSIEVGLNENPGEDWDVVLTAIVPTRGLPEDLLAAHYDSCVRIPIRAEARSLNLSNSAAIGVFEALRQQQFPHLKTEGKMADWNR